MGGKHAWGEIKEGEGEGWRGESKAAGEYCGTRTVSRHHVSRDCFSTWFVKVSNGIPRGTPKTSWIHTDTLPHWLATPVWYRVPKYHIL